jgi:glycosyltransferase involved in cell wall biosynthesis
MKNKISIFYDFQIFLKQKFGGASRYFFELGERIANNATVNFYSPIHINRYFRNIKSKSFNLFLFKKFMFNSLFTKINQNLTCDHLKKNSYSIIHPTYYDAEYLKDYKLKKVITVFDLIHEKFSNERKINEFRDKKKYVIQNSDFFICISKNTQKDLINFYNVKEEKTKVIYLASSNISKIFIYKKMEKPFILYIGNRSGYKNFNILVKAFSTSKEIKNNFLLCCFGGGSFTKEEKLFFLQNKISQLNVLHLGDNEDFLASIYEQAVCLVYPSTYEGFGLPILEAMQYKCPVICSQVSSMPEVAGNAVEYFNPHDYESLLESIKKVLYEQDYKEKLIDLGLQRSKIFSWNKCAKETLEVYNKIAI